MSSEPRVPESEFERVRVAQGRLYRGNAHVKRPIGDRRVLLLQSEDRVRPLIGVR